MGQYVKTLAYDTYDKTGTLTVMRGGGGGGGGRDKPPGGWDRWQG